MNNDDRLDLNQPDSSFVESVRRLAIIVSKFHKYWQQDAIDNHLSFEMVRMRIPLFTEEVKELEEAISNKDYTNMCDEAADILFVALGTIYRLGIGGHQGIHNVALKNSNKTKATHTLDTHSLKIVPK